MLSFGSLFAGIGGFDLGFERAGMTCSWQVEIDPFCRKVLAKHWPHVRRHDDVRTFPPAPMEDWNVDVVCGGFPCQDISNAGKKAGIEGEQSGLWVEFARIVRQLRPRYVVVENVAALRNRGLARVCGDLASCGYDAEWDCIPAAAVGAPFVRDRLFLVAYRPGDGWRAGRAWGLAGDAPWLQQPARREDPHEVPGAAWWATEPDVDRLVHGVPPSMDRLRVLGNCVVPRVAELIGRQITGRLTGEHPEPVRLGSDRAHTNQDGLPD